MANFSKCSNPSSSDPSSFFQEAAILLEGTPQSELVNVKVPDQIQALTKIALSMTMNVDYQQLTSDDKDDFKGKVQNILVESVNDPQAVIVVMLTPGSVKVLEIVFFWSG